MTWISRFLWSVNSGVKLRLVCRHAIPLSSHAVTVVSTSCRGDIEISVHLLRYHGADTHLQSWCDSILRMTVELVQGNQVYLECFGTSGSFGMVARPLESSGISSGDVSS